MGGLPIQKCMRFFQKLATKTYEKYIDRLAGILAGIWVAMTISIIVIVIAFITTIPSKWLYAFAGFVGAVLFIFIIAWLIRHLEYMYRKKWLSDRQKKIVCYLGSISGSGTEYQDVLQNLEVADNDKHWVHIERRRLQALGLVHYEKGWVELTDAGNNLYDKLVQQGVCDSEDDMAPEAPIG